MTLARLRECLSEPITDYRDGKEYPKQQEALERRHDAIRKGDLLALYSALERCFQPVRRGFSYEDASLNPALHQNLAVCEVPAWLLGEVCLLLWQGMGGTWPKGRGRQATAVRRSIDAWRDTVRAWKVLSAHERGVPWGDVFEHVSATLDGAGSTKTVEDAYYRVVRHLRSDPDYYRRMGPISPRLAEGAAGLPTLGP
jgi:hypothetical protein